MHAWMLVCSTQQFPYFKQTHKDEGPPFVPRVYNMKPLHAHNVLGR